MTPWTFWQYVTNWGEWPFRDWYNRQDPHVRNAWDFAHLALLATEDWRTDEDLFREFTKAHVPLSEICFRGDDLDPRTGRTRKKRRIRVFGLLKFEAREFVVYGAGEELRGDQYFPSDAADNALKRYRDHLDGRGDVYGID